MNNRPHTSLSLIQFAKLLHIDPFHMAGWCVGDINAGCDCADSTWTEDAFQNKYVSRAEVSEAIYQAEQMVAAELGYYPAPRAIVGETHAYPATTLAARSYKAPLALAQESMLQKNGRAYKSVLLNWARIADIGVYVDTALGDTEEITIANNRFAATIQLPEEPEAGDMYRVFFRVADRGEYDAETDDDWQLDGLTTTVTEADGIYTLTISGYKWQLMKPAIRTGYKWQCKDISNATNLVTALTVNRRRIDRIQHGTLQWRDSACQSGCDDETVLPVCLDRADEPRLPYVRPKPHAYNAVSGQWEQYTMPAGAPRWVTCNYVAGVELVNGQMDMTYAKPVAFLAASMLERSAADCNCAGRSYALDKYRDVEKTTLREMDFTRQTGLDSVQSERVLARPDHLDSKWGGRYGAVMAWRLVQAIKQMEGSQLT